MILGFDPRGLALATAFAQTLAMGQAFADEAPCASRYPAGAAFPSSSAQTGEAILSELGGKGWGLKEDVTVKPIEGAPAPHVLEVRLPRGSIDHKNTAAPMGGMGFRWRPKLPAPVQAACLSYSVWFDPDFPFNKGGKLPGLFGGDGPAGGKAVDGETGFSARFMWRAGGRGEVYAYIPGKPDGRGESIDRGAWVFPRGRWVNMQEEIVLNAPGEPNGHLRVWVDGQLKLTHDDVLFRNSADFGIDGVMADIFFGGKKPEWAAPADTKLRLTPFALAWR